MDINHASIVVPPPPLKFTLDEWHFNNLFRCRCAEAQQELSDRLLAEAKHGCESATEIVKTNKEETDHRLDENLGHVEFWKKELLRIRKEIFLEINALSTYKERIRNTLQSINALEICEKCLIVRERRLGIDLVHDVVEKELLKEREVIHGANNSLQRVLEEIFEQIRRLKATEYSIDYDLKSKEKSLRIDRRNIALKEIDPSLSIYHGTSHLVMSTITLAEWESQTNNNIIAANKEVNSAKHLRCYVDTIIKQTIDDLNEQKDATNNAFKQRIKQTQVAKTRLELQHATIVKQVAAMTSNITEIKKCIANKEGYVALAHTRLGNRCQRSEMEFTRDSVEISLVNEVHKLRSSVSNLQQILSEAEASLRYLLKTQIQLEEDINIKTNTLKIDEVECMTLRQSIEYRAY